MILLKERLFLIISLGCIFIIISGFFVSNYIKPPKSGDITKELF